MKFLRYSEVKDVKKNIQNTCLDTFSDMLTGISMHNVDCGKHCAVDEALIYRPFSRTFAPYVSISPPLRMAAVVSRI